MIQRQRSISVYTSTLIFSVLLLLGSATTAHAQLKMFRVDNDSIPLFRGFAVSFDLVGPAMLALGDYGTYEGALRINLHDQWFPIFEMGIGRANHNDDENTHITYKTTAPFFRIGMDWNIMRNKHTRDNLPDPIWGTTSDFGVEDMKCSMHWLEAVFGLDAKIYGPLHLGWMVRYKRRIAHNDGTLGATWYVPGFGKNDNDGFAANFNVIIDI